MANGSVRGRRFETSVGVSLNSQRFPQIGVGSDCPSPLSLSGVELDGSSLVRFIYCDESGTGGESILVVAGVIVHGDTQWKPVEKHIGELIRKYVRAEHRLGFVFRATELFSGSGRIFKDREKYPLKLRFDALKELLSIPSKFRLPVIGGFIPRQPISLGQSTPWRRELVAEDQALAFSHCLIGAEKYMRKYADPTEIAKMVAEDNTETKKSVARMHDIRRSSHPAVADYLKGLTKIMRLDQDLLPISKIVDSVSFEGKRGAILLQVADACAFIIRSYLEERPNIGQFARAFIPSGRAIANIEKVRASRGGILPIRCWD